MGDKKTYLVVFDCNNKECGGQAIVSEVDNKDDAIQQAKDINGSKSAWATCAECNQTHEYFPNQEPCYVQGVIRP